MVFEQNLPRHYIIWKSVFRAAGIIKTLEALVFISETLTVTRKHKCSVLLQQNQYLKKKREEIMNCIVIRSTQAV